MHVGIDLGSRAIKLAAVKDGQLVASEVVNSSFEPHKQAAEMIKRYAPQFVAATGYGRHLAQKHFAQQVITEIKAHALGAKHLFPDCRTILDVGGQDSKVIALDPQGRVAQFQMNDKCAAGTGRFMEMMAASLGYSLDEFSLAAAASDETVAINSMCAVFAESEVVSLRNRGTAPEAIARAIHLSIVDRLSSMLDRVGLQGELVFSGGVARNSVLVDLLAKRLGRTVSVPNAPEIVGAYGAALYLGARAKAA
ncbi:MAG: 3-hydroxyacyl-ACP dehydratase [Desulfuromonadales bacterium]|nr:3-hydroxyacyl-ACP dehydratase [Desulfuromonadales bacterium]MBN2791332.1 3-hydroxyacyl-ACP dehydratase [Desulfuromonadales bacterium]